jgi:hypothetical protein
VGPLAATQPSRPSGASRIIRHMADDLEVTAVEQSPIFRFCEARMIKLLAIERVRTNGLAVFGASVEHQHGVVSRVHIEHGEHRSLSLVREVEETVPDEPPVECQPAHVGDNPFLLRQPITRQCDHFRRGVHPSHVHTVVHQEARDGLAAAAAEIEHVAATLQLSDKSFVPDAIVPSAGSAGRVPLGRVAPIKVDDGFRQETWNRGVYTSSSCGGEQWPARRGAEGTCR